MKKSSAFTVSVALILMVACSVQPGYADTKPKTRGKLANNPAQRRDRTRVAEPNLRPLPARPWRSN